MFDHPVHTIIVHFPAGLIPTSVIFFILYLFFRKQIFDLISILLLNISLFFTFIAIITGIYDWQVRYNGYFIPPIAIKFYMSLILFLLGILIYILRKQKSRQNKALFLYKSYGYITLYFSMIPIIIILTYFGSELIYHSSSGFVEYNLDSGSKIFFVRCNSCHPFGQGISSSLIFPPDSTGNFGSSNLISSPLMADKKIFKLYIRNPKRMPRFTKEDLSDEDAGLIFDYIKYLKDGIKTKNDTNDLRKIGSDTVKNEKVKKLKNSTNISK